MTDLIDEYPDLCSKYPGWWHSNTKAYIDIGRNGDLSALERIDKSCVVEIPYDFVAMGAAEGGNLNMLSYCIHKDRSMEMTGIERVARRHNRLEVMKYLGLQ
jgi:hypothetical protein